MHVHAGLRVDIRELEFMRHNNGNMLALWSRKLMCRWIYATGTVYLQCRLRVYCYFIHELRRDCIHLYSMHCWVLLYGNVSSVHSLHAGVLLLPFSRLLTHAPHNDIGTRIRVWKLRSGKVCTHHSGMVRDRTVGLL
jgi:hypothetical protein